MTACRECGKPISTQAMKCTHCGIESPGKGGGCAQACGTIFMAPWIIAAIALVLAFIGGFLG